VCTQDLQERITRLFARPEQTINDAIRAQEWGDIDFPNIELVVHRLAAVRGYLEATGTQEEWALEDDQTCIPGSLRRVLDATLDGSFCDIACWPIPLSVLGADWRTNLPPKSVVMSIRDHFQMRFHTSEKWDWLFVPATTGDVLEPFDVALKKVSTALDTLRGHQLRVSQHLHCLSCRYSANFSCLFTIREDDSRNIMVGQRRPAGDYVFDFFKRGNLAEARLDEAISDFVIKTTMGLIWHQISNPQ